MMRSLVYILLVAFLPSAFGHGMLTRPAARNVLLNLGLTHPGAGMCDMSEGNPMNMNGCQGGVGPFTYNACWISCGGDYLSTSEACTECKKNVVALAEQDTGLR